MADPPSVLIVEDDAMQARLVEHLVAHAGLARLKTVATADEAVALAASAEIILLDYRLEGERTGLDALREMRARGDTASIIIMTAHGSERVAAEALHLGASDYIIKDEGFTQLLPEVLARVVRLREIERALHDAQQDLIRAERRAAIGEITVALSHEINSPLQALRTQLEIMRLDEREVPEGFRRALAAAMEQLERVAGLLRRVGELQGEAATTYVGTTKMTDLGVGHANRLHDAKTRRP